MKVRNIKKIKEYAKTHKKEIVLTVTGGAILTALGVKHLSKGFTEAETLESREIGDWFPEGFGVGKITELWNERGHTNAIVEDAKIEDLGKLGEEFLKLVGMKPDDGVSIILGIDHETVGI